MQAKFIYEKFTLDSDPIKDMGIGIFRPGTVLYIPSGYVLGEGNMFYKRYKNTNNNVGDIYVVTKIKFATNDIIEVGLEQVYPYQSWYDHIIFTHKQFMMFYKKYQNMKNEFF